MSAVEIVGDGDDDSKPFLVFLRWPEAI